MSNQTTRHGKMTEAQWYAECERNWYAKAGQLIAEGWERHDHPGLVPATFSKPGTRDCYLVRDLGTTEWYLISNACHATELVRGIANDYPYAAKQKHISQEVHHGDSC